MAHPPTQTPATPRRPRPRLPQTFTALRQYNFRLYWFGQMISLMGTWMQSIGQSWLVLRMTHSPWQIGVVGALQLTPTLLFSIFAGVLADRWPKRAALTISQTVAALQALTLWALVTTGTIQLWHLYVLATLLGVNTCLDAPTRQAFMVEMVGRDDLPNAVALNATLRNLARIAGPSLGGVIIATSGVDRLFLLNGLSYIAALAALLLMRGHEFYTRRQPAGPTLSAWRSLREGLAHVFRTPALALAVVIVGLALLFGSNFNVLLPVFATAVLHTGPTGFGFLSAAFGAGSLVAALWIASGRLQPAIARVLIGVACFGALELLFATSRIPLLSLALLAGVGFMEEVYVTLAMTMIQLITPDHLQGRVMSVNLLFLDGTVPPGYLLTGWLASAAGAPIAMGVGAVGVLVVAGTGWLWQRAIPRG